MDQICYECLEVKRVFLNKETNQLTCHDCFGKTHNRRRTPNQNRQERPPMSTDQLLHKLKNKWANNNSKFN